ncbi:MAG: hypothetical protein ACOX9B_09225 [Candidatus Xenobium sp.]|nr:hypothetical protein [Burkholderiales bacterium]
MNLLIHPLLKTRDGRKTGEFPVGSLSWNAATGTVLDSPDRDLLRLLQRHFSWPIMVRRARGGPASALLHEWEELAPGSEEHFREAVNRLHRLGFVALPLSSQD